MAFWRVASIICVLAAFVSADIDDESLANEVITIHGSAMWVTLACCFLIINTVFYAPWNLKMPEKILLPLGYSCVILALTWSMLRINSMRLLRHQDPSSQRVAVGLFVASLGVCAAHTFLYHMCKIVKEAFVVCILGIALILGMTFTFFQLDAVSIYPCAAMLAWWLVTLVLNYTRMNVKETLSRRQKRTADLKGSRGSGSGSGK
eukprot:gnl/Spiro4/7821_TR4120_c0_g1_i2.p1 gnl/Spiro4/7821_TR4120_c0_g1~~gnl/Spiro4/7821_TR4120_c0_g1_i2.p1  ORF type:complete len:205 (+),score=66.67 gnl/Spiro4/7821_TR4120_c0_g1_i2:51-665(+)